MKFSLKRNLLIGFGISLIILIISSAASYISISNLLQSAELVNHTNLVVQKLEETISTVKDAETGQRGFLITGKDEFLQPYNGSLNKAGNYINDIRVLTADNPVQQSNIDKLEKYLNSRFSKLQQLIDIKRQKNLVDIEDMEQGKIYMDNVRSMVSNMIIEEKKLMKSRTDSLNRSSANTPIVIIIAAILAIIITILFYLRMSRDINIRTRLQDELVKKDAVIRHRIAVIQSVSDKISGGDYSVRVADTETDDLGSISGALNKMAGSLEHSFKILSDKEWLQSGIAGLNNAIMGDNSLQALSQKVINFITEYTKSKVGAFYVMENDKQLRLLHAHAISHDSVKPLLHIGEDQAGQCVLSGKLQVLHNVDSRDMTISFASAAFKPASLVVFPLVFEKKVKGVIELGALHNYTERELDFFNSIAENIGIAINTVLSRLRVQELLEETQAQSEELMTQQTELEQINAELEAQAQQLQTSEEELKVQSEELIETNSLLEERSASLEERNKIIQQKNIEIEKKAADLALSTKYKSEFLANMSHELRTPLNSIILLSRLMSDNNEKNLTDDQVQYANVIQSSGNGLLQLIDEILDLSKIESGKMTVEYLPVPVKDITSSLGVLFEPIAKQASVAWKVEVAADVPAIIETDRMRLEQILKNLLSNAFKFTHAGSVTLRVHSPVAEKSLIHFVVKDTGIGISPDKQDLIFEAFQQEDGSTRRKYGGTGLGLSISRELARLLGGSITLTSEPGKGSEFTCIIPALHQPVAGGAAPDQLWIDQENMQSSGQPPVDEKYFSAVIPKEIPDDRNNISDKDKVILIIEDDVKFAAALLDYARQKGYKGIVAVQGDKGIDMASKYRPAGILLDLQLPVKSGWQVLEALKENGHTRHIPVHVMSSFHVRNESLQKGALDFIDKPVAFEQLNTIFQKIELILNRKENKVLIIEENNKHAKALAYYLGTYNVKAAIYQSVPESIQSLQQKEVNCVILDMSGSDKTADQLMDAVRKQEGLEELPIILFTGKSLSQPEEFRMKKYADTIVMKTANSYQRILDEISLFLHLVTEKESRKAVPVFERSVQQENALNGKTVLLADDDVRNIYSMTKVLEKYGMKVIPAMDGREALSLSGQHTVDVVLMDMMMPEMDGYESIKAIRANPLYKNTPVIAVTAKAMTGDREKCIAAGASDYISKPVDMDQLISLLRIWLYEKGY